MASISSPGIGSGLDTAGIISKLMAVESQPLTQLQTTEDKTNSQISAYGQVQSDLSTFQSTLLSLSNINTLNTVSATSSDSSVASVTTATGAAAGNYTLEVSQLAQAQQLVGAGQASSTATIGSGSATTITFDFGTISGGSKDATSQKYSGATFTSNGLASKSITIDSSNNTLTGIRDAINGAGMGVTATIINDGTTSPYRLLLTNSQTGATQSMRISVNGDSAVSSLMSEDPTSSTNQNFSETSAAQSANFKLNGVSITKTSNVVSDALQGVTFTLNKTNVGSPINVSLTNNSSGLASSIKSFIQAYNTLDSSLASLTSYDQTSKTGAVLYGESTIAQARNQIKNIITKALPSSSNGYTLLNNIGITFQKDGTLAADSTKLNNAISSNFSGVAGLFAANGSTTDSLVQFTSSTSDTKPGSYALNVSQVATQGKLIASGAPTTTIDSTNDTLNFTLDGVASTISLTHGTYSSASDFAAALQAQINGNSAYTNIGASVQVAADPTTGQLTFTSNRYGGASSVGISGSASNALLGSSGSGTATQGVDMVATINGTSALTSRQTVLGVLNTDASGLKMQVLGGTTGSRGTINYTQGVAYQLNQLINSFSGTNGLLQTRLDGLNTTIKRDEDQKLQMQQHLTLLQKQYQDQYNALDVTMATLNSTSSYLTGQFAAIANTSAQIAGTTSSGK